MRGEKRRSMEERRGAGGVWTREEEEYGIGAVLAALGDDMVKAVTCDRVREATVRDSTLLRLMEMVTEGVTDDKEAWTGELREFYKHRQHLTVVDGVLMYKSRVIIPRCLRGEVLEGLHAAHQGIQGMRARAQDTVFWPGMAQEIKQMVDHCEPCQLLDGPFGPPVSADSWGISSLVHGR